MVLTLERTSYLGLQAEVAPVVPAFSPAPPPAIESLPVTPELPQESWRKAASILFGPTVEPLPLDNMFVSLPLEFGFESTPIFNEIYKDLEARMTEFAPPITDADRRRRDAAILFGDAEVPTAFDKIDPDLDLPIWGEAVAASRQARAETTSTDRLATGTVSPGPRPPALGDRVFARRRDA